jgi:hypothetical protein
VFGECVAQIVCVELVTTTLGGSGIVSRYQHAQKSAVVVFLIHTALLTKPVSCVVLNTTNSLRCDALHAAGVCIVYTHCCRPQRCASLSDGWPSPPAHGAAVSGDDVGCS